MYSLKIIWTFLKGYLREKEYFLLILRPKHICFQKKKLQTFLLSYSLFFLASKTIFCEHTFAELKHEEKSSNLLYLEIVFCGFMCSQGFANF